MSDQQGVHSSKGLAVAGVLLLLALYGRYLIVSAKSRHPAGNRELRQSERQLLSRIAARSRSASGFESDGSENDSRPAAGFRTRKHVSAPMN